MIDEKGTEREDNIETDWERRSECVLVSEKFEVDVIKKH